MTLHVKVIDRPETVAIGSTDWPAYFPRQSKLVDWEKTGSDQARSKPQFIRTKIWVAGMATVLAHSDGTPYLAIGSADSYDELCLSRYNAVINDTVMKRLLGMTVAFAAKIHQRTGDDDANPMTYTVLPQHLTIAPLPTVGSEDEARALPHDSTFNALGSCLDVGEQSLQVVTTTGGRITANYSQTVGFRGGTIKNVEGYPPIVDEVVCFSGTVHHGENGNVSFTWSQPFLLTAHLQRAAEQEEARRLFFEIHADLLDILQRQSWEEARTLFGTWLRSSAVNDSGVAELESLFADMPVDEWPVYELRQDASAKLRVLTTIDISFPNRDGFMKQAYNLLVAHPHQPSDDADTVLQLVLSFWQTPRSPLIADDKADLLLDVIHACVGQLEADPDNTQSYKLLTACMRRLGGEDYDPRYIKTIFYLIDRCVYGGYFRHTREAHDSTPQLSLLLAALLVAARDLAQGHAQDCQAVLVHYSLREWVKRLVQAQANPHELDILQEVAQTLGHHVAYP